MQNSWQFTAMVTINFKIDISVSNNFFNRILEPEIHLYITLENGKTFDLIIDVKIFQELRKSLALNIKKIMDNEGVNLLK
jgi:hypothetical protein